jgi:GTP cyclohydrolase II
MALAGLEPVAGYTEIVDHWGRPADLRACLSLARQLELAPISLRAVIVRCERVSAAAERSVEAAIPTPDAAFTAIGYTGRRTGLEYVAFVAGLTDQIARVHVHGRCVLGGVFGSQICGCGKRLNDALAEVRHTGQGVIIYRGGDDTSLLDGHSTERTAGWAVTAEIASILHDLGATRISLSSNEQIDPRDLDDLAIEAVESYRPATAAAAPRLGIANAGKNASISVAAPSTNATV